MKDIRKKEGRKPSTKKFASLSETRIIFIEIYRKKFFHRREKGIEIGRRHAAARNTVKVAKDTDREKFSSTKNAHALNLSFDSHINQEEHIQWTRERSETNNCTERKCKHTHTQRRFSREIDLTFDRCTRKT